VLKPQLEGYLDLHKSNVQVAKQQLHQRVHFTYFMLLNFEKVKTNIVVTCNHLMKIILSDGHFVRDPASCCSFSALNCQVNEYQTAKPALIRDTVIFEAIAKCLRHRPK